MFFTRLYLNVWDDENALQRAKEFYEYADENNDGCIKIEEFFHIIDI